MREYAGSEARRAFVRWLISFELQTASTQSKILVLLPQCQADCDEAVFVYCCCTIVDCPVCHHNFLLSSPAFALLNAPAELLPHKLLQ
jgi:hypothetical protein